MGHLLMALESIMPDSCSPEPLSPSSLDKLIEIQTWKNTKQPRSWSYGRSFRKLDSGIMVTVVLIWLLGRRLCRRSYDEPMVAGPVRERVCSKYGSGFKTVLSTIKGLFEAWRVMNSSSGVRHSLNTRKCCSPVPTTYQGMSLHGRPSGCCLPSPSCEELCKIGYNDDHCFMLQILF